MRLRTVPVAILWNVISSTTLTDQSWSLGPFLTFSFLFYQPCGPYLFPIFSGVSYFDLLAATLTGTLFFSHLSDSWFALGLLLFGEYTEFFSPPWVLFCLFFHLVEDVEGGKSRQTNKINPKRNGHVFVVGTNLLRRNLFTLGRDGKRWTQTKRKGVGKRSSHFYVVPPSRLQLGGYLECGTGTIALKYFDRRHNTATWSETMVRWYSDSSSTCTEHNCPIEKWSFWECRIGLVLAFV